MEQTLELNTKPNLKAAIAASADASLKGVCEVVATKNGANGMELKILTKSTGKVWYSTLQQITNRVTKGEIELIDDNTFRFKANTIVPW